MHPILFLLPDLDAGGSQRTLVNLANTLSRRIPCVLASVRKPGDGADWLHSETPFRTLCAHRTRDGLPSYIRLLHELKPSVVLSSGIDANILTWVGSFGLSEARRPQRFVRETNSHRVRQDIGFLRRLLIGPSYRSATGVIALSEGVGKELIEDYKLAADSVTVIGNPVDVDGISRRAARARAEPAPWLDRWGSDVHVLLSVGRLHYQKGYDRLLKAFFLAKQSNPNLRLVILGEGPDNASLLAQAAAMGMEDSILLFGFCDDVVPWYAHADMFVLLSRWEGFGHVIVEAMAAGVCVVVTDCSHGPRDIISDGKNGVLLTNGADETLCEEAATAIGKLISQPDLCGKLAAAGMERAKSYHLEKISTFYLDVLNKKTQE